MERSAQAMPSSLANFYGSVVQDVIHNLRSEFEAEGVDESVLDELQTLWESKLKSANVLPADYRRPICSPKLNLNANPAYEGEGWTPTVDNVFAETPGIVNTPGIVHTPGIVNTPSIVNTPGQGLMSSLPTPLLSTSEKHGNFSYDGSRQLPGNTVGHSLDFMAPPPSMPRETNLFDMNVVYVENGDDMYGYPQNEPPETKDYMDLSASNKRKRDYYSFQQLDGAADIVSTGQCEERRIADEIIAKNLEYKNDKSCLMISQLDGIDDNYNDHVTEEDYNLPGEEDPADVLDGDIKPVKEEGGDSEGSEPPLNEDDDDDVDDFNDNDQQSTTDNLVVAQFEKVTKVKGKWKCILKDGIMQLNKKDYLFSKANGEPTPCESKKKHRPSHTVNVTWKTIKFV
ncbi:hypothetical protein GOP47_0014330 [Adiantum capillus-veneris]|uniref:Uncharacterized protein n=1 Tax=Adiantum capillus-veneris TaxID=13818 RepID=A0A9D4UM30_ADICA|nr:hypothetical protein GOP47_0014330 [Adiantum capillus-veneris]